MREMGEGPAPPHTVPHGFWAGREISTLGHAGGWVREQGKARTRLSAGQRRLTSGQQVWGCQGSQDVHVPSQGSSSAQLREPRAGDGARRAWGEGAATPAASEGARWRPARQRGRRTKHVCRTRRACARSPSLPPRPEAAPGTGAPRGCLGAGRGAGGSGSGDRRQFVGAHPHTWEVRARWCVQRARDGSRELGPQGCGNRRRRPNGRRASDKCPRCVAGPSSPPGRRRAARGAPAECRSRGPWRGRAGASPCRVPARPPRGFLSAQHVPRRSHALSPVLSSARRGSRLPPCRVPSSQHGAWRHRWPAGLDSRSGRRVDGAALSASRRSSRLFQNANSCPVDRTVFKCICIRACYGGKILKKVSVRAAPPGAGAHAWCVCRGETCARQGDTGMAAPRSPVLRPPRARAAVRSHGSRERHGHGRPGLGQEAGLLGPGLSECAAAAMGRAGRRRGHAPSPFSACVCTHAETRKACVGPCCRGPEAHPGSHECRRARLGAVGLPLH